MPAIADFSVSDRALRIAETDLAYSGGLGLGMERFYRSDSSRIGLFGRGWGSRYETRLTVEADGGLVVHECGCGPAVTFRPIQGQPGLWEGPGCDYQRIKQIPGGYQRLLGAGKTETFSSDGRLLRAADTDGNWVAVGYDKDRIAAIEDNYGRKMVFAYAPDGRLDRVEGEGDRKARYQFDPDGRLIAATDSDGVEHAYSYDENGLLVAEIGPDGNKMTATYEFGRLAILSENGGVRRFGGDEGEGWRELWEAAQDSEGHLVSIAHRIQLYRTDSQGQGRLWRELSSRNGSRLDTEYNDLGLPAIIRDGNGRSGGFRYDARGRLVHKETADEILDLRYDPKIGKVSRIERRSGGSPTWSTFTYNGRGNLVGANDELGRKVSLTYDEHGRIAGITQQGRYFTFTYNRESKPTTIALAGVGTIRVEYDQKGEIARVESSSGPAMALKVTSMFQHLLTLVRPADVKVGL
ncbi:MAG: RHS repeat protein [Magnetospirillum sp.]|nr:MAG: RHS repeat protein [Magnetospirillum sp.]